MTRHIKQISFISFAFAFLAGGIFMLTAPARATDDITAYFIWNCGGSNFCSHKFNDLTGEVGGEFHTNFYVSTTVTDDADQSRVLDLSSVATDTSKYAWLTEAGFTKFGEKGYTATWGDPTERVRTIVDESGAPDPWDYEHSLIYDPMGGRIANNSINTNANRAFRATIYNDGTYEALQFGVNESDYHYFLNTWDPMFIDSTIDISDTTPDNPAIYTTYLQEPALNFSTADFSASPISTIEALVENPNAVTITNDDGHFTITFRSNYYQKVLFKATAENGAEYYFRVNRITGTTYENFQDVQAGRASGLKFGYKLMYDSGKSYTDYEVRALVTYADGSTTVKIATPTMMTDWDDEEQEEVTRMVWDAGKNLKSTAFAIDATADMVSLDFTVTNKDAFALADTYGGTFTGAGKGIHFDDFILNDMINRTYNH